jgi:site-specific DNA-cytosine methylase
VKTAGTKIRALDLFCGAGGSSWGAREAGIEIVAAFDLWPLAGKAHDANFPEAEFIHGRLEEHDVDALAKKYGKIDLILASPECTNHSPAKGNKPRCEQSKDTAFQVVRFAKAFKPRWIVIENVVNMRKWTRYAEFKTGLETLGYKLQEQVLNSAHFGVAQSRRRLFLTADLEQQPAKITPRKRTVSIVADIVDLNGTYKWTPLRAPKRATATLERAERGIAVNREGLDENQALNDLRDMMEEVLSRLETMRYAARPREAGKGGRPVGGLFTGFDLKPITEYIARELPQDKKAKELVEKTEAAFGGQLKEIQTVLARYQRLSTLGQLIDHVLHEGRQPIASINNEADLGISDIQKAKQDNGELVPLLAGRFTTIRKQGDVLAIAFRRMEPFGGRRRGRPAQLYLEEIIRDAFAVFAADIDRLKVKTTLPSGRTLHLSMH